jgi:D-amino peptidase
VIVNDSHGTMDNLIHELLDPRARLVFGSPKAQCMAEGMTSDCDMALFIGYHAPAGERGVLAHTFSSNFTEVRMNGVPVSEAEVNGLYAASLGVPVGLVTGDDVICRIASRVFPGVETVEVKVAHGFTAADSLSPPYARKLISESASRAVARSGSLELPALPAEYRLAVDMPTPVAAEMASGIPGSVRTGDRGIECTVRTASEVLGLITVFYELGASAMRTKMAVINRS